MTCSPLLISARVRAYVFPAVHCVARVAFRRFVLPQLYTEHSKILLWELSAFLLHPWPFLLNNRDGNIVSLEYIIWMTGNVDWYRAVDAWITLKLHLCAHSLRKWMPRLFLHGLSDFALFFFFYSGLFLVLFSPTWYPLASCDCGNSNEQSEITFLLESIGCTDHIGSTWRPLWGWWLLQPTMHIPEKALLSSQVLRWTALTKMATVVVTYLLCVPLHLVFQP